MGKMCIRDSTMAVNGPFWQMREWMGFEGLCFAMADDPKLVDEMALFWEEYVARVLARALKSCKIDHIIVNEDMAYNCLLYTSRRTVAPAGAALGAVYMHVVTIHEIRFLLRLSFVRQKPSSSPTSQTCVSRPTMG